MQARNHENSDEIRPTPVRHLDLATPAFTTTVRTPSVTTLFGEKWSFWGVLGVPPFKETPIWRLTIKLQDGKIDVNEGVLHKLLYMRDD